MFWGPGLHPLSLFLPMYKQGISRYDRACALESWQNSKGWGGGHEKKPSQPPADAAPSLSTEVPSLRAVKNLPGAVTAASPVSSCTEDGGSLTPYPQ